jgi:hypothetical protein
LKLLAFSGFNPNLFEGLEIGAGNSRLESFPIASRESLIVIRRAVPTPIGALSI